MSAAMALECINIRPTTDSADGVVIRPVVPDRTTRIPAL